MGSSADKSRAEITELSVEAKGPDSQLRCVRRWRCSHRRRQRSRQSRIGWEAGLRRSRSPSRETRLPMLNLPMRRFARLSAQRLARPSLQVQISNAFGTEPLVVDAVHIAYSADPATSQIVADSDHAVTFDGKASVTVPAGASYWSDPVALAAKPLTSLAVTIHFPHAPAQQTGHPGSRTTSYIMPGRHMSDTALTDAKTVDHWYQLAGIAVSGADDARAIVTLGDSITDGRGSTTNGNDRLARSAGRTVAAKTRRRATFRC